MRASKQLRCGILGTGWMLGKYTEIFRLTDHAALVAVASRDGDRAKAAAGKFGIARAHASYEALVNDPGLDLVINALHNGLHCEWSVRALEAGKHVLCEKPLACSTAEAGQMFAAAHSNHRWLLEGFMYRFHPQLPLILQRVRAGQIGRVLHIHSHRMSQGREPGNPRYRREAGGGALLDIGCYCVNFSRAVAGTEPVRATATAHFEGGVDRTCTGTLEFPENVTAQFCCSFESEPSFGAEIVGTAGRIVVPHPWMPPVWPTEFTVVCHGQIETVRAQSAAAPQHVFAPFALELEHFCECIHEDRAPQFPPGVDAEADSRANMRTIEVLLESARSGRKSW